MDTSTALQTKLPVVPPPHLMKSHEGHLVTSMSKMARGSSRRFQPLRLLAARRLVFSAARRLRQWMETGRSALCCAAFGAWLLALALAVVAALAVTVFLFGHGRRGSDHLGEFDNFAAEETVEERPKPWSETISWNPRVFLYHNFLSREECEHLITLGKRQLRRSAVISTSSGRPVNSSWRTSSSNFVRRGLDEIVHAIEQRISDFTFIPVEHGENLQVVRYEVGERYKVHNDYFVDEFNMKNGGQRMLTFLMYLNDVEEGGETVFPYAVGNISSLPWYNELSECARKGLPMKPKMGDAVLFWNMKPNGSIDELSVHEGCPVVRGTKWISTKWLHVNQWNRRWSST